MSCPCLTDLLGVPFKVHGRGADGLDCWGLVMEVYRRYGIELTDYWYSDMSDIAGIKENLFKRNTVSRVSFLSRPCIMLLNRQDSRCHVAVYIGDGLLIHSTENKGVVIEPVHRYKSRIRGVYNVGTG